MDLSQQIEVRVFKCDGAEHRRWKGKPVKLDGSLLVLEAEFDVDVSHELLGAIPRGTKTIEYYWLDRWYNVFRFLKPDGSTWMWYCNINTVPTLEGNELSYVDLDIDVLVQPDGGYRVLDLDEFEMYVKAFEYADDMKSHALIELDELIWMINERQFPFVSEPSIRQ